MQVLNSIKYKFDRQTSDALKANGFICFEEYRKRNFGVFFCIFIVFFYDDKNSVANNQRFRFIKLQMKIKH